MIEVLVAIMLSVLVGGIVFQVVRSESRFASVESAKQEVQQNSRGALEIIASELRAAQPGGLVNADANTLTFLMPRVWGVTCGGNTATSMTAIFPAAGGTAFDIGGAPGLMVDTAKSSVNGKFAPSPVNANAATVTQLTALNPALGAAGNACAGIRSTAPAAGLLSAYTITGTNFPVNVDTAHTVYLYQKVKYDVAQVGDEYWIRRQLGGDPQPLAGPVDGATGLTFSYRDANGNTLGTPITTLANLANVARIRVTVTTHSRTSGNANLTDTQTTSIELRNP